MSYIQLTSGGTAAIANAMGIIMQQIFEQEKEQFGIQQAANEYNSQMTQLSGQSTVLQYNKMAHTTRTQAIAEMSSAGFSFMGSAIPTAMNATEGMKVSNLQEKQNVLSGLSGKLDAMEVEEIKITPNPEETTGLTPRMKDLQNPPSRENDTFSLDKDYNRPFNKNGELDVESLKASLDADAGSVPVEDIASIKKGIQNHSNAAQMEIEQLLRNQQMRQNAGSGMGQALAGVDKGAFGPQTAQLQQEQGQAEAASRLQQQVAQSMQQSQQTAGSGVSALVEALRSVLSIKDAVAQSAVVS